MLSHVFMPRIPLQNQVSLLEIIRCCLSVKNLLHLVLERFGFVYHLIPNLLHFHQLVNSPLEWIWLLCLALAGTSSLGNQERLEKWHQYHKQAEREKYQWISLYLPCLPKEQSSVWHSMPSCFPPTAFWWFWFIFCCRIQPIHSPGGSMQLSDLGWCCSHCRV